MGPGFESPPGHHVGASCISLAPTFLQKSKRTHSAVPPFQPRTAALGSRLVLDADLKTGASKVFALSNSSQASYRLRRVFMLRIKTHSALILPLLTSEPDSQRSRLRLCRLTDAAYPMRCYAGFRFGLRRGESSCLKNLCPSNSKSLKAIIALGLFYMKPGLYSFQINSPNSNRI